MKTFRVFSCCGLLAALVLTSAGCATTSANSHPGNDTALTKADKQWDDLSPAQKAGTVLWWPLQNALVIGGEALAGH